MRLALAALLLPAALAAPTSAVAAPRDPSGAAILPAMRDELGRSMARLRLADYEKPYFIAYTVRDYERDEFLGRLGAVFADHHRHTRQAAVDVRVGDYQFDNTSSDNEQTIDLDDMQAWEPPSDAPLDDDPMALRSTLWLLTDHRYKHALADYARKRGKRVTTLSEDEGLPSFSREPPPPPPPSSASVASADRSSVPASSPASSVSEAPAPPIDRVALDERVRAASARFLDHPELFDGEVKLGVDRMTRYFVNSEGAEVKSARAVYSVVISAATRASDGMLIDHEKAFYGASLDELPDAAGLDRMIAELATELASLRAAPMVDPYTGPAILMQQAAGVFFHETIGHRLEGERQNNEKEGRTFKGQIGQRILPEFLSIHDDPTLRRAGDGKEARTLNGYYRFDDEGVPARDVTLIDKGVLRDYLMSRTPIKGSLVSNGHGRAEGVARPMGRMGNLIVASTKRVSEAKLKQLLLDEVRRQKKPFGLIIRDITGGSTNTSNYGFQAFKGQPRLVYRVDAKTGAETLVRGVEMVGTPLASINKIVATSDTTGVFNGFCGAESGFVPVSTVAPAMLFTEIELQRSERGLERAPILPAPFAR